jgi:hypothetical protein
VKNGCNSRILCVNISDDSVIIEEPEEVFYRIGFGGRVFVAYHGSTELINVEVELA